MKEINYILLFDQDLINSSVITMSIYKCQPESSIYRVASIQSALKLLNKLDEQGLNTGLEQEAVFIVDFDMDALQGCLFLNLLRKQNPRSALRVYIIQEKHTDEINYPLLNSFPLSGQIQKPLGYNEVMKIVKDPSPVYVHQVMEV